MQRAPRSSVLDERNYFFLRVVYLTLIPVLLVVVASFGALYCILAWLALNYGNRFGAWIAWALYVPAASLACILKLTGIASGGPVQPALVFYYFAVAFAGLGLPLLASTLVLTSSARRSSLPAAPASVLIAWIAALATTPLAVALVAIVDLFSPLRTGS